MTRNKNAPANMEYIMKKYAIHMFPDKMPLPSQRDRGCTDMLLPSLARLDKDVVSEATLWDA